MDSCLPKAIRATNEGRRTFCKFLSANDTGATGAHQSGVYIPKNSIPILFDKPGTKGENKHRWVEIRWHDGCITKSRFIYYGQGSRNEYRITNFGKGFPYFRPDFIGSLFILVQDDDDSYRAFVLDTEDDIDEYMSTFSIGVTETNRLLDLAGTDVEARELAAFDSYIQSLLVGFPLSSEMARAARAIDEKLYDHQELIITNPDKKLVDWTDLEYRLFRALEKSRYSMILSRGFENVDDFVAVANEVLNRRKSRAGKSLEHHLGALFAGNQIEYCAQAVTEGKKKPDFLFPSQSAYHDLSFPDEKLLTLAAKTTCKDRWRQVITEADRLKGRAKYLCTLQQGITSAQMDEMAAEQVVLVVPSTYIGCYPADRRDRIWTIGKFISFVKEKQAS